MLGEYKEMGLELRGDPGALVMSCLQEWLQGSQISTSSGTQ